MTTHVEHSERISRTDTKYRFQVFVNRETLLSEDLQTVVEHRTRCIQLTGFLGNTTPLSKAAVQELIDDLHAALMAWTDPIEADA